MCLKRQILMGRMRKSETLRGVKTWYEAPEGIIPCKETECAERDEIVRKYME